MPINLDRLTLAPAMRLFGVTVLYTRPEALPFAVAGVFDRQHVEIFGSDGQPVSTLRAQLAVRLSAFPAGFPPAQDDLVQVALLGGRPVHRTAPPPEGAELLDYVVQDVRPQGEGEALLILAEA